jgi:DNA-binding transcriptional regulator GbsR (MarR family)
MVKFNNKNHVIPSSHLPKGYYHAARENQQMLQNLAAYRREVEAGTNNNSVRRLTRKRNNVWSQGTAKNKANELAKELYGSVKQTKKRKAKAKKTKGKRKTHAHKHMK